MRLIPLRQCLLLVWGLVLVGGVSALVGLDLTATTSTLYNDFQTYLYDEPCSAYLRNPPEAQANLSYGFGRITPPTYSVLYPTPAACRRFNGTDNLTYAYVGSTSSVVGANLSKNGSLGADSTNLTERLTLRLTQATLGARYLVVAHRNILIGDDPNAQYAAFQIANGTSFGNCSQPIGGRMLVRLTCLQVPLVVNGSANVSGPHLVLTGQGPAIHFVPQNSTTEWFYVLRPDRTVEYWEKLPASAVGTSLTAAWSWVDACITGDGCAFGVWTGPLSTQSWFGIPNMSTTLNVSDTYTCQDLDLTDGNDCIYNSGCRITFQRNTNIWGTIVTTGQGTANDPADCGGKACNPAVTVFPYDTTCYYNSTNPNWTNQTYHYGNLTRALRLYRANVSGSSVMLRATTDFPGSTASNPQRLYIAAAGGPNVTNNLTIRDGISNANNGTNGTSRLLSNTTIFTWFPVSDGALVNASLWGNMSVNGSNSTTFRLLGTNNSCVANQTCTVAFNVTDAANYSWMACVQNNYSFTTGTDNTTELGYGCTRTWVRNTSKYTANLTATGEKVVWFNASFPRVTAMPNTPPALVLLFPLNGSVIVQNSTPLNFSVADNESGFLYCNVTFNGTRLNTSFSLIVDHTLLAVNNSVNVLNVSGLTAPFTNASNLTANGTVYTWSVRCCDLAGLCTNSGDATFTVTEGDYFLALAILLGLPPLGIGAYFARRARHAHAHPLGQSESRHPSRPQ